jgi:SulP family sulfate permease
LFFGNIAQLIETIKQVLVGSSEPPIVVIVDFTLVMGMDSSAAHAIAKLKKIIHRVFHVEVSIYVTGSDRGGFPCEYALSEALSPEAAHEVAAAGLDYNQLITKDASIDKRAASNVQRGTISISRGSSSVRATQKLTAKVDGRVCESLDDALRFAEDILIARIDSSLETSSDSMDIDYLSGIETTIEDEISCARKYLSELLPEEDDMTKTIDSLLKVMKREEYKKDDILWETGAKSDSMKLLICGELLAIIDDTGATEDVQRGNLVGELGLVHGTTRLTTLVCMSEKAVLYSLNKNEYQNLKKNEPHVASAIDGAAIRYLAHRVQHVSNRYFHTTLPI